ncbi:ABC-F family ATP-binding cassette domain-containing protein [Ignavibacteria bacterium]|nr:ABC-F family ATP-binding cassette domain-containing protein [Bacteroidota bacterium]MCZ2132040.1 ABC-F family ATP-binding cassette domain-containing protein [Bacteroidota bacterium]
MTLFSAANLTKIINDIPLFENISFGMEEGEHIGLIGRNGVGKTTLLRILAGRDEPDGGNVAFNKEISREYLEQLPSFDRHSTALEAVLSGKPEIAVKLLRYAKLCDKQGLTSIEEEEIRRIAHSIDEVCGWTLENEARTMLARLGMEQFDTDVMHLSGGQRKRVALARVLLSNPDLLILDEPTNHLDATSSQWLQDYIQQSRKGLLLVTHDRYFLDAVSTKIIELERSKIYSYPGNFEKYLERKESMVTAEQAGAEHLRNKIRQELAWLQRGVKARRTKQQSRIDWIARMKAEPPPPEERKIVIEFGGSFLGGRIIDCFNISKKIDDKLLFSNFTYSAAPGDKIGVIGPNGSGKSTFLNIIAGLLPTDSGSVKIGETVKIGYFRQENTEFNPRQTVLGSIREIAEFIDVGVGRERYISARELLERFMFPHKQHGAFIETLSGGERRRLALVRILIGNPNVLLLDEPTNDFDIPTLSALEEFLGYFKGTLLIVSHDRSFLDKTVDFIYSFENGNIKQYPGNYTAYLEKTERQSPTATESTASAKSALRANEQIKKPTAAGLSYKERKELDSLEKNIADLEAERDALNIAIGNPSIASDYKKIAEIGTKLAETEHTIETATERWLTLSEKIDKK